MLSSMPEFKCQRGFTLIELTVVVAFRPTLALVRPRTVRRVGQLA